MRIVFAGTPEFALPCLEALIHSHLQLVAIYTQPDRPAGRGRQLQVSAVKQWALTHEIPVEQPLNFKSATDRDLLRQWAPDVMVVIAYGLLLPPEVLAIPRYGCINVHASLLPRWRGASPIQHAILKGDTESGITIMQMDAGMDTGPQLLQVSCPIESQDTAKDLHDRLAKLASKPLLEVLNQLETNLLKPTKQEDNAATYAPKIKKTDARIDWQLPASTLDCQIRAFNPWPIAYFYVNEEPYRVYRAHPVPYTGKACPGTVLALDKQGLLVATSQDALLIETIQSAGTKVLQVADWCLAPRPIQVGSILQ